MRYFSLFLGLLLLGTTIQANPKGYKKQIKQADDLVAIENFDPAIAIYNQLLVSYPDDDYVRFKAAECYLFSESHLEEAIELLQEVTRSFNVRKEKKEFVETFYYLGQAYHLTYQFERALDTYHMLLDNWENQDEDATKKVKREIECCENAIELCKDSVQFKITNLGPVINTDGFEHSPVVSIDENRLLFTSVKNPSDASYNEDVFTSEWRDGEWSEPHPVKFNTNNNNATVSLSPDGNTLIVYGNNGDVGNLYYSEYANGEWGELTKFPEPINSLFRETHASLSLDGNTIYFASDRPGGFGGQDIYMSRKLPDGSWGEAVNLGEAVNTQYDEDSPSIQVKDSLLYFSSEGHNSMGGFDIFSAHKNNNGQWDKISNIGYPINTPFDDNFYNPTADGQRVYYASDRENGYGGTDIYLIEYPDDHEYSLTLVSGYVYYKADTPATDVTISLWNKKKDAQEGIYRVNPSTGKYIFIVPSNEKFVMTIEAEGYKTEKETFKVPDGKSYHRKKMSLYLNPVILKEEK